MPPTRVQVQLKNTLHRLLATLVSTDFDPDHLRIHLIHAREGRFLATPLSSLDDGIIRKHLGNPRKVLEIAADIVITPAGQLMCKSYIDDDLAGIAVTMAAAFFPDESRSLLTARRDYLSLGCVFLDDEELMLSVDTATKVVQVEDHNADPFTVGIVDGLWQLLTALDDGKAAPLPDNYMAIAIDLAIVGRDRDWLDNPELKDQQDLLRPLARNMPSIRE